MWARHTLGADIDVREAHAWAWEELYRIEAEMAREARRVAPDAGVAEAVAILDETECVEGEDAYLGWLRERHDRAVRELDGRHFDIDPAIRRVEARLAPEPGGSAAYYTAPSEDMSRPGRTWWPTGHRSRFGVWQELTTVFHEGVPGITCNSASGARSATGCPGSAACPVSAGRARDGRSTRSGCRTSSAGSRRPDSGWACSPRRHCAPPGS